METILALFGSSGFGAILGALGGLANRWMDYKTKSLEIEMQRDKFAHEKDMRQIDVELMKEEVAGKIQVATIEGEAKVEVSGYEALAASYKHDADIKGTPITNFMRAVVRPFITIIFMAIVCYVNYKVWVIMDARHMEFTADQVFEIIRWTLFEASVVIGWWFAMRSSGSAGLKLTSR